MIKKIIKSLLIGIITLLLINIIGQFFNFNIPINILNVILIGFLRLPGLIILIIFLLL